MRLPLSFETSLTRADLLRLLPAAVGNDRFVDEGRVFRHEEEQRSWRISLDALPDLKLGRVRLDRYRLTFVFEGYADAEIADFMARFELYFRRGGG